MFKLYFLCSGIINALYTIKELNSYTREQEDTKLLEVHDKLKTYAYTEFNIQLDDLNLTELHKHDIWYNSIIIILMFLLGWLVLPIKYIKRYIVK